MLDKSVEWFRVILKRNPGTPLPPVFLPQRYAFVTYLEGDEQAWDEIDVSAGTFETVAEAAHPDLGRGPLAAQKALSP